MISLENNPALKKGKELEDRLNEAHKNGEKLYKEYVPIRFPPLTEKQAYDLETTVYD